MTESLHTRITPYLMFLEISKVRLLFIYLFIFKLEFTTCKAGQPGTELQEKHKKIKAYRKSAKKNLHIKGVC